MVSPMASLVSGGNKSAPVALIDGVMIFNLILWFDWQMAKEAYFRRVGAERVALVSTFLHSPLRTGLAPFNASGSPSVALT